MSNDNSVSTPPRKPRRVTAPKKQVTTPTGAPEAATPALPAPAAKLMAVVDIAMAADVVDLVPQPLPAEQAPRPAPKRRRAPVARKPVTPAKGALLELITQHEPVVAEAQPAPVYQIYFRDDQRDGLDPDLIPYSNAGQAGALREFEVFERLQADEGVRLAQHWGAVSWKFFSKTGLSGEELARQMDAAPGADLYYCNPSPDSEALYINLWQQGVVVHPGFRELCESVFEAGGLEVRQLDAIMPSQAFSTCNYFVGSQAFWASYLPFVRALVDRARATLPAAVRRMLDSSASDPRNLHAGSSYWPFIVERLLPVYLRGPGAALRVHKLSLPNPDARLNPHLRRLREMKDVAHRTRSQWMYSCWLHYRNLYMLQTNGREWCLRYLPQLTATDVVFW